MVGQASEICWLGLASWFPHWWPPGSKMWFLDPVERVRHDDIPSFRCDRIGDMGFFGIRLRTFGSAFSSIYEYVYCILYIQIQKIHRMLRVACVLSWTEHAWIRVPSVNIEACPTIFFSGEEGSKRKLVLYGCFLKWWYPQNTSKWSVFVGKPMVLGYPYFLETTHISVPGMVNLDIGSFSGSGLFPISRNSNYKVIFRHIGSLRLISIGVSHMAISILSTTNTPSQVEGAHTIKLEETLAKRYSI